MAINNFFFLYIYIYIYIYITCLITELGVESEYIYHIQAILRVKQL
jgi:hypothetical protein